MQKLFTEFEPTTAAQWKEQLIKDLKGLEFDSLVWHTDAGIDVQPFYTKENLADAAPHPVFTTKDWAICEWIRVEDEKTANRQALNALQNGASGLVFTINQTTDYAVLLNGILLEHIYCLFKVSDEDLCSSVTNFLEKLSVGSSCFVEYDRLISKSPFFASSSKTLSVNTLLYHEAGANSVNELALSLAHLNEYLHALSEKNTLKHLKHIHLSIAVGGDFFMEIAKLRTLRNAVGLLLEQYGLEVELHIHAQTTLINKSITDSYNNMLRSTTEAMSASIGGANSILVLPFDAEFTAPNDFSARMARNQQLILKDESYLNVVADISAGSYYIESLTDTLGQKAWEKFKQIEAAG
ncbi:MAG: methylmalonyl-CoA mutase family protein, partial [Bacteroidia bacterium]|nr:methylmalonyl-CoA mutase family protein [Bacteroidia bacterium]